MISGDRDGYRSECTSLSTRDQWDLNLPCCSTARSTIRVCNFSLQHGIRLTDGSASNHTARPRKAGPNDTPMKTDRALRRDQAKFNPVLRDLSIMLSTVGGSKV